MRDRGRYWTPVPDWAAARLEAGGVLVTARANAGPIWLVSGDVGAFLSRATALPLAGLAAVAESERYALRLAPDRLLVMTGQGDQPRPGWQDTGFAATDVSSGFVAFDVTGAAAIDVVCQGSGLDFARPPGGGDASAMLHFAGLPVAVGRLEDGWRLHIERPLATALWTWLETVLTP